VVSGGRWRGRAPDRDFRCAGTRLSIEAELTEDAAWSKRLQRRRFFNETRGVARRRAGRHSGCLGTSWERPASDPNTF